MKTILNSKNSDVMQNFIKKYGFNADKVKKSYKFFSKRTKRNHSKAFEYTYDYIDLCYKDKGFNSNLSVEDNTRNENDLISKFSELNKKYKYTYSILLSVLPSFLITLLFIILQSPDSSGTSYMEIFNSMLNQTHIMMNSLPLYVAIIVLFICLPFFIFLMTIPLMILYIVYVVADGMYYSAYRNFILPYEIKVVLNKLQTYNERYQELL